LIGSRFQPLVFLVGLGGVLLLGRLYQVQVQDHEVWALEAARLVHSGREVPYQRGTIRDRNGAVLARDVDGYALELVYRTFRREHPLGQVAHALSLLEGRAVSLEEVRFELEQETLALARLSPRDWRAFAEGDRFSYAGRAFPATPDPSGELRGRRAGDLSFYLRRIFGENAGEWKRFVREALERRSELSLLDLVARRRNRSAAEEERVLVERVRRSLQQLERLSRLLVWPGPEELSDGTLPPPDPLDRIVYELECARRSVEDAAASRLFREASGFSAGRVDAGLARDFLDVSWIARRIGWDEGRTAEWIETSRASWVEGWRDRYALPPLVWSLALEPAEPHTEEELLDRLAVLFGPDEGLGRALDGRIEPWRELEQLAVFERLEDSLAADVPGSARELMDRVLPIQLDVLREAPRGSPGLASRTLISDPGRARAAEIARSLEENLAPERLYRRHVEALLADSREILDDWERSFQEGLEVTLIAILAAASPDELSEGGELRFAEERVRAALEQADFYLKDHGMRPRKLVRGDPSYDVIYLLEHYRSEFPGFRIRRECRRVRAEFEGGDPRPAEGILGAVSAVPLPALLRQRGDASALRSLKRRPARTDEEERELRRLISEVYLPGELEGVSGVEGFFNRELTGRNGYEESLGLQNAAGGGLQRNAVREAQDGLDVRLTLDVALQAAAQRTLRNPAPVPSDPKYDWAWSDEPVGAITLISLNGDVLAAASEPDEASVVGDAASGQRLQGIERAFRKPTFQPPGSVFKPFVAAYALERGLDPHTKVDCAPLPDGRAGYVDLHCWNEGGHGPVDLHMALVGSCNSYFAWLGESFSDAEFREMAKLFGFGHPTGVGEPLPWDRDDTRRTRLEDLAGFSRRGGRFVRLGDRDRRMAGNGLGVVEATPMQVARATLGLASGELPSLRLAMEVGDQLLPLGERRRLGVGADALAAVRKALAGVVGEASGTARSALGPRALGLDIACKTGSADIRTSREGEGRVVRKHTWVAGWVPAERPVAAFTIFEHDTRATSSHGAIYLARQFLQQPEVLAWLEQEGVDVSRARALAPGGGPR